MIPVETTPGIRQGRMKEISGGDEFWYNICDSL
jgi:hypothetical protein